MTKKLIFIIIGLVVAAIVVTIGFSKTDITTKAKELRSDVTSHIAEFVDK